MEDGGRASCARRLAARARADRRGLRARPAATPTRSALLAVTKTVPGRRRRRCCSTSGSTAFGENRVQEAGAQGRRGGRAAPGRAGRAGTSSAACSGTRPGGGALGRRVESVDSRPAGRRAGRRRRGAHRTTGGRDRAAAGACCSTASTATRSAAACPRDGLLGAGRARRRLRRAAAGRADGVAPLGADPDARIRRHRRGRGRGCARDHPEATALSAGMSGDLEIAIRHGSDVVRVGTALVGERPLASR